MPPFPRSSIGLRNAIPACTVDGKSSRAVRGDTFTSASTTSMSTPCIAALAAPEAVASLGVFAVVLFALASLLLLCLLPAILSYVLLKRIPAEHRKQEPGLAFLLVIPLFSLIWAFFVYPRIADSLRSSFSSRGQDRGDCGRGLALATCICAACTIVPLVNMLAGPAALILLLIFFVKSFSLSSELQRALPTTPPAQPIAPPAA